jgi:hypothetical protein
MTRRLSTLRTELFSILAVALACPALLAQDAGFTTPAGQQVPLSSMQGKVTTLFFSGTQDPQCRDEFKALNSLAERFTGKPVSFCWVSVNTMSSASNDRLKEPCGPIGSVVVLRDPAQAIFKRLAKNQSQIPTLVILDQKGQVYGDPIAGFNPDSDFVNTLAGIIDSLLAQQK